MSPKRKTIEEYEREAVQAEGGCLLHPTKQPARKVFQLRHGPLSKKQYVCHRCDTPNCIADEHHFIGTCGDNVRDAVAKRRHSSCRRGEAAPRSILTEAEAREVLVSPLEGTELAKIFGVTPSTISRIRRRKNWRWL